MAAKKLGRFSRHQLDRHRLLLAEAPERAQERQNNIHSRNTMLAATQAYNLNMENRNRMPSHITRLPGSLQKAAVDEHMGDLVCRAHCMAKTGLPEQMRG